MYCIYTARITYLSNFNNMLFYNLLFIKGHHTPSLKYLNEHVRKEVGSSWHDLGIDLLDNNDVSALNTIRSQYPNDINKCCTEMFQLWLKKQPTASWNQLINSLKKDHIGLNHLATKIEQLLSLPKPTGTYFHTYECIYIHCFINNYLGCEQGFLSIQYSKPPIKISPISFLE